MSFAVLFSTAADEDLQRIFNFLLLRELDSQTADLDIPEKAIQAIQSGMNLLRSSPFACRKVGDSPFVRELIISFGSTGYVALYEIINETTVIIGAIRHQREEDNY